MPLTPHMAHLSCSVSCLVDLPAYSCPKVLDGGSPQLRTTLAQGRAIEEALASRGISAKSYIGMRYWHPFTEEALADIKADGIERLVVRRVGFIQGAICAGALRSLVALHDSLGSPVSRIHNCAR